MVLFTDMILHNKDKLAWKSSVQIAIFTKFFFALVRKKCDFTLETIKKAKETWQKSDFCVVILNQIYIISSYFHHKSVWTRLVPRD